MQDLNLTSKLSFPYDKNKNCSYILYYDIIVTLLIKDILHWSTIYPLYVLIFSRLHNNHNHPPLCYLLLLLAPCSSVYSSLNAFLLVYTVQYFSVNRVNSGYVDWAVWMVIVSSRVLDRVQKVSSMTQSNCLVKLKSLNSGNNSLTWRVSTLLYWLFCLKLNVPILDLNLLVGISILWTKG